MKAEEIMSHPVRCISADTNLTEAAALMRELDVGALPICEADRLTGMVTDRDIVVRVVAEQRDPAQTTVREAMSPGIHYAFADQEISEVAAIMEKNRIRRLPVVSRDKRLVGIIATADIARAAEPQVTTEVFQEVSLAGDPPRGGR